MMMLSIKSRGKWLNLEKIWNNTPFYRIPNIRGNYFLCGLPYIDALIVSAPDPGITPTPVSTMVPGGTYEDNADNLT